jgi:hypothetical protein
MNGPYRTAARVEAGAVARTRRERTGALLLAAAALLAAGQIGAAALAHDIVTTYARMAVGELRAEREARRALAAAQKEAAAGSLVPPALASPTSTGGGTVVETAQGDLSQLFRPLLLAEAGAPTHDPRELLRRADRLAAAGLDITIIRVAPSPAALNDLLSPSARRVRVVPARLADTTIGVQLFGLGPPSAVGLMAVASGDVILAINGYPIAAPETALEAYQSARAAKAAVVEVQRGKRRLVFAVKLPAVGEILTQ